MKLGYIRVSTQEQNESRQIKLLQDNGVERLFIDKKSGKNADRPELKEMLLYARDGDTIVVESISRLARNTKDLLFIVEQIKNKGAKFISLKENIDTDTISGKFMLTVFAAMSELERGYILERQKEGIEIAKMSGKYTGRMPMEIDEEKFKITVNQWRNGEIQAVEAMKIMKMTKSTFYRKIKEAGL